MVHYKVFPSKLSGEISASPSKSHTLRAILFASMAHGKSKITNYLNSPDTEAMVNACRQIGAKISIYQDRIEIIGVSGKPRLPDDVIDCGNSGQVLRFMGAIFALIDGYVVMTGDHSIRHNRPLNPLIEGLGGLGATCISTKKDGHAPLIIKGPIHPGETSLDGEDSQPVSALLIAAAFMNGSTKIKVRNPGEKPWVGLTLDWLHRLGIKYTGEGFDSYTVFGRGGINAFEYNVPGDFSSVAFPLAAALITKSEIKINNIDANDSQGDKKIIDVLIKMGAQIEIFDSSIVVKSCSDLHGIEIDVNDFIDAVIILAVVGCFATGQTRIFNAKIARAKECDRLHAIATELTKMGANVIEFDDGLIIKKSVLKAAEVETYNDHRMAMSLAIAALGAKGSTLVKNTECINKSYKGFYQDMQALNCKIEVV